MSTRFHLPFIVLFAVAAFFLLKGLDNTMFWQDEGHGAVLAQRILKYGYPRVWDGHNLLTGMDGLDFNQNYALTWDGWLPYYLVAGSFALFGPSTWAGRFPFVLSALVTIPLLYLLVLRLMKSKATAFWSVFFLVSPLMFLMHSRQCRYYALLPLSVLLTLWGIFFLPRRKGLILTAVGLVIFYHSNLVAFGAFYISLLFLPFIFGWNREQIRSFSLASLATIFLTLPMFLYSRMWNKPAAHGPIFWNQHIGTILGNIVLLNKFYVPLLLLIVGYVWFKKRGTSFESQLFEAGLVILYVPTILICFVLGPTVRYLYHLFPVTAFLSALVLMEIYRQKKWVGILLFMSMIFTHALDYVPFKIPFAIGRLVARMAPSSVGAAIYYVYHEYGAVDDEEGDSQMSEFYHKLHKPTFQERFWRGEYRSFWDEIMHPFPDNFTPVIQFLREHRKPDEGIYLNVGQFPLMFYAPDIKIVYTLTRPPKKYRANEPIDSSQWDQEAMTWYVPRPFRQTRGPFLSEENFLDWVKTRGWQVIQHEFSVPFYDWDGNWPERFRLYRTLHGEYPALQWKPLVIYQVVRGV